MAEVEGLRELNRQFDKLGKLTFDGLPEELLQPIFDESQKLVPVKTGYLKSTGKIQETKDGAEIIYEAPYSASVEFGTSKMPAHPYLRPAIDRVLRQVEAKAKEGVQEEINTIV